MSHALDPTVHFADLILTNGRITTFAVIPETASAVAIRDGRFIAVGEDSDVLRFRGPATAIIDLQCRCVVPGFVDAHTHLIHGDSNDIRAIEVGSLADATVLSEDYFVVPARNLAEIQADLALHRGKVVSTSECFRVFAVASLPVSPRSSPPGERSDSEGIAA